MRLLIVDDSRAIHSFVSAAASNNNWETISAYNGQEALDQLQKDTDFDLVLLDWEMPVKDGPETLAEIRKTMPNLCVIMLTSKNRPKDIRKMLDLGANDYMMKPITSEILTNKINDTVDAI